MAHTPYGLCAIWRHLLPPIESRARRATQLSPVREKYNCSKSEGKKFAPRCGKKWVNVIGRVVYRSALKLYLYVTDDPVTAVIIGYSITILKFHIQSDLYNTRLYNINTRTSIIRGPL